MKIYAENREEDEDVDDDEDETDFLNLFRLFLNEKSFTSLMFVGRRGNYQARLKEFSLIRTLVRRSEGSAKQKLLWRDKPLFVASIMTFSHFAVL